MFFAASPTLAQECNIRSGGTAASVPKVVYFDVSSSKLKPEGKEALQAIAERYKGVPGVEICLVGQADASGNAELNEMLVKRRIAAVQTYLKQQGLGDAPYQKQVRSQAFGETFIGRMVGQTAFESDRRVEIKVIEY
ncbi:OmpA family protein [Rhodovibrionaceae bacterium A322]